LAFSILEMADEHILWIVNQIYITRPHLKTIDSRNLVNAAAPLPGESETQMNRDASKSEEPGAAETGAMSKCLAEYAMPFPSPSLAVIAPSDRPLESAEELPEGKVQTSTIVQFSCFMYFCDEDELSMSLDVMRIGDVSGRSEVIFTTKDGTAIAGQRYEFTSGTLVFEPGETEQCITIPLIRDDRWNTTLEFGVELLQECVVGALLGRYLFQTRVKVIDNTTFPTDKYKKEIKDGRVSDIPKWGLLIEYLKLNWDIKVVKRGTKKKCFWLTKFTISTSCSN